MLLKAVVPVVVKFDPDIPIHICVEHNRAAEPLEMEVVVRDVTRLEVKDGYGTHLEYLARLLKHQLTSLLNFSPSDHYARPLVQLVAMHDGGIVDIYDHGAMRGEWTGEEMGVGL